MIRYDLYTKIVLTVIAVCLVILCTQSLRTPAPVHAQTGVASLQRVVIAGFDPSAMKAGMQSIPIVITGGNTAVPVTTQGLAPLVVTIAK